MEYGNRRVVDLKALVKERGLRGYSRMRKAELIELLQNNPPPAPTQCTPMARAWPTSPQHPTRPPPPPPVSVPQASVGFRPEMLRQLEERNPQPVRPRQPQHPPAPHRRPPELKPYQLKPKTGQETFIEPPVEQKEVPPPNSK